MNIGFFGDSYVDLDLDFHAVRAQEDPPDVSRKSLSWCWRLCNDLEYAPSNSGLGGSNQFYSIESWQEFIASGRTADYAIFTFTWENRLYGRGNQHDILRGLNENAADIKSRLRATQDELDFDIDELILAGRLYHSHLAYPKQNQFIHELMIKWILELPEQYPDTRFIFLPNTELSREIALKYFKKGILLNFAFEKISLLEGEHVGVDPYFKTKFGHMTDVNHERFKTLLKNVIISYNTFKDKVYPVDYEQFRID
jgi:hypothetical protein